MEEIIKYKKAISLGSNLSEANSYMNNLKATWQKRLNGCTEDIQVWKEILAVRSLALAPQYDVDIRLRFASLCRKGGRLQCES